MSDHDEVRAAFGHAFAALRHGETETMIRVLRTHLLDHVMPFWTRYAWDEASGSLCTCIDDQGAIASRDKWLWSQWRAVWVFSRLFRSIDRDPAWLERARRVMAFCIRHGWLDDERGWALVVGDGGAVLRGHESTYTDAFAVYGMAEYLRAVPDETVAAVAGKTAEAALTDLSRPYDTLPHFPYPIPPGAKPHGVPMLWSLALAELGDVLNEPRYRAAAVRFAREIMRDFHRKDDDVIVEFAGLDGSPWPAPEGTAMVPGHVVEDMWFQLRVLDLTGDDPARRGEYLRLLRRHLEMGWDREFGGITLAVDIHGSDVVGWNLPDLKLWWPQTEALYGVLLGWSETGDASWLDWYERLWTLCLDHYVDWEHGEWRQKLNRDLTPFTGVVALPVKDPFHLPRSLILQMELLETMLER